MSARDQADGGIAAILRRGWRRIAGAAPVNAEAAPEVERRSSKRVALRLPVEACVQGGKFEQGKLVDVSLRGIAVEPADGTRAATGQEMSVRLRSPAAGVAPFVLTGNVVRTLTPQAPAVVVDVARGRNSPESLASFRKLVLFYLRRKPLLEEIDAGALEGRCTACDWVGRVASSSPECPACGQQVVRRGP